MCGITGYFETVPRSTGEELEAMAVAMAATLHHRGPDDSGVWTDPIAGIALAHRRLSILDLSPLGHQPMQSPCGRYMVTFNGEIYNFRALRQELEARGQQFRGQSDTEVLVACVTEFGILSAVRRLNGMFAFALWDRRERQLYLVRDRLGEKPLYYGYLGATLVFGSELKALRTHPEFGCRLNRDALALYMRHNYIPAPFSIYEGISKVLPGTMVRISSENADRIPTVTRYWSVETAAEQGLANPFTGSEEDAVEQLDTLLRDAVKHRMEADVPLGAFLSGGIDSSLIVALMQAQSAQPVRTFTIGFQEAQYNEANHAKAVAQHLGTDHTELFVTPQEAMAVIPQLPVLYDEPFSDSSQIPTFLVSKLARRDVTVVLSGDGGDELFGGYNRYLSGADVWRKIQRVPSPMRALLARSIRAVSVEQWNRLIAPIARLLTNNTWQRDPGKKLYRAAQVLAVGAPESLYLDLVSHWKDPAAIVLGAREPLTAVTDHRRGLSASEFESRMMYIDSLSYLPDDILVKVDRASMAASLEVRVPFLDHRLVEFSWRVPLAWKIRQGKGKWLLRKLLQQYVPLTLTERPKKGFGVPIDVWLRGPLREWAECLLEEKRLKDDGFFDPQQVRAKWGEHLRGPHRRDTLLWIVLMFQSWLEHNRRPVECRESANQGTTNRTTHRRTPDRRRH
ncbi:MAG: asparagine synthase (glutamine-hydrolyzing) [Nitrospira sp.]